MTKKPISSAIEMREESAKIADAEHRIYVAAKGRDPEKYESIFSRLAKAIRALEAEITVTLSPASDTAPPKKFYIVRDQYSGDQCFFSLDNDKAQAFRAKAQKKLGTSVFLKVDEVSFGVPVYDEDQDCLPDA